MIALLCALLAVPIFAQRLVLTGGAQTPFAYSERGDFFPVWTGGVLLDVGNNDSAAPVIHVFDETGQESTPIAVTIPGDGRIRIDHIARGADGAYAFTSYTFSRTPRAATGGFVAWIPPDHQTINRINTGLYVPFMVTIAPDGTLWTVGAEMKDGRRAGDSSQHLIRHFDTKGTELGSFVPLSSFADGRGAGLTYGLIVSNKDRVGWYALHAQQYFEVTFDGKISSFAGIDAPMSATHVMGLALTDNGDVVVSTVSVKTSLSGTKRGKAGIFHLDRSSGAWVPLTMPSSVPQIPSWSRIYGADGNRIAVAGAGRSGGWDLKFFELR